MDKKQILEKAITKATEGGWQPFSFGKPTLVQQWHDDNMVEIGVIFPLHDESVSWVRELEGIIFNHDFCEALWGQAKYDKKMESRQSWEERGLSLPPLPFKDWQTHLMRMVVAEDPVQYLGDNI